MQFVKREKKTPNALALHGSSVKKGKTDQW